MKPSSGFFAALVLACFGPVEAFFRINCGHIQKGRIDPLVSPGRISGHAHSILGGSNIGINATADSMTNSECTSCEINADKSAYWSPTLYYRYPNGSFLEVPHDGGVVYYLGRGPNTNQTIPFPKGLNMLTGSMSARSYNSTAYTWGNSTFPPRPIADRVSFLCLKDNQPPEQPYMFDTDCPYGMRAQVHFQSCWNGKDLYKADNSHVAYQSAIDNGVLYSVANVPKQAGGRFVFAQGDPTGYGFHADFQNGWDADVLATAVRDCLSVENFGTISECPILFKHQNSGSTWNCPERPSQIGEKVTGLLPKLPGCNEVFDGPAPAPAASNVCLPGSPQPSVTTSKDSTPRATTQVSPGGSWNKSPFQKYVGCYSDSDVSRTLIGASIASENNMTVDFCHRFCNSKGYRWSGVEYGKECWCGSSMQPSGKVYKPVVGGPPPGCTWDCSGTLASGGTQQICGGFGWMSVYYNAGPKLTAPAGNNNNNNSGGSQSPSPSNVPTKPLPANYVGCATDSYQNSGRALLGASTSQDDMTASICAKFCSTTKGGRGFYFYGTEYGRECYCGNALAGTNFVTSAASTPKNTTCSQRCSGDNGEICGGSGALSLYKNTAFVAPKIKSPVGHYLQRNCLTDPNGSGGRALTGFRVEDSSMTAEVCVKACADRKFQYAGVENGAECYCGSTINPQSGAKAQLCPLANLVACAGDFKQYCGGPSLLNLYYAAKL